MVEVTAMTVFIKTSHYGSSASHTDGCGIVVVVEGHTVGSKAIDVRSLYVLVTVTPQGVGALVVRKKKDQVGSGILRKE